MKEQNAFKILGYAAAGIILAYVLSKTWFVIVGILSIIGGHNLIQFWSKKGRGKDQ